MKRAIVTGAAGFAGCNLTEYLLSKGYEVYAVLREKSAHNSRLTGLKNERLHIIYCDMANIAELPAIIREQGFDTFFHMAWEGGRNDYKQQYENVGAAVKAVKVCAELGCRRFIGTGSQAEYGICETVITEETPLHPFSAYGEVKVAACFLTKACAKDCGVEWIWCRIFSLIGKYEPEGRMIPDLVSCLKKNCVPHLSAATQYWDYLDASDCAAAFTAVAQKGQPGEIYNIANGEYHHLKTFVEKAVEIYGGGIVPEYGSLPVPCCTLRPSVDKLKACTGWQPVISFEESLKRWY